MEKQQLWLAAAAAAAGTAGAFLVRSQYEREQLSVEHTVIETDKIQKNCTAVFLSDLHNHEFGAGNRRLINAIDQSNPDLILIGGDMMTSKGGADVDVPLALIRELIKRYPVYYGNGNHETRMNRERKVYGGTYDFYMRSLEELGVVVLGNRTEYYRGDIAVTGIDLEERFYEKFSPDRLTPADLTEAVDQADREHFQILLCHSPLYFDSCRRWGADLTLSGHYHGGTIRVPVLGGVMTPQFQFFLPWCAGTFQKGRSYMVVSRGLGTHSINIRINNKPQVVVLDIIKKTRF